MSERPSALWLAAFAVCVVVGTPIVGVVGSRKTLWALWSVAMALGVYGVFFR